MDHNPVVKIRVQLGENVKTVTGRQAWALNALIEAGAGGLTTLQNPAPRWSHYVYMLRHEGFLIETENEGHKGAFAGTHARYRLRSHVTILELVRQSDKARAAA